MALQLGHCLGKWLGCVAGLHITRCVARWPRPRLNVHAWSQAEEKAAAPAPSAVATSKTRKRAQSDVCGAAVVSPGTTHERPAFTADAPAGATAAKTPFVAAGKPANSGQVCDCHWWTFQCKQL